MQHSGLDDETLSKVKEQLLSSKKKMLEELKDVVSSDGKEHQAKFPEYGDKADDNAQEIDGYTTNLATEKILDGSLRDIENALKRIEDGTYGICKYCKKEINPKRLLARPEASACVECKSKLQGNS